MTPQFGYSGNILRVDLSSGKITSVPTAPYSDRFLGGRGIAAKQFWDEVPPDTGAYDPDNMLVFATGPLCGVPVLGGSRWVISGKSRLPTSEHFSYSNLGGSFGAGLKSAGYDAIAVKGASDKPVYLYVDAGRAELREASDLWGKGAIRTRETLKERLGSSTRVAAIGPAGENMVVMANIVADQDSTGSGGLGAVMGSKNLKAIAVGGPRTGVRIAKPEDFHELVTQFRSLRRHTFPLTVGGVPVEATGSESRRAPCYGCIGCLRSTYTAADGKSGKFMCHQVMLYHNYAQRFYGKQNDVTFYAAKLCDEFGLDTIAIEMLLYWLPRCHKAGPITEDSTGIPFSKLGSLEFIETLVRKVSLREGFGELLSQGIVKAAAQMGETGQEILADYLSKTGDCPANYSARLVITTGLMHALEPRIPLHQLHQATRILRRWLDWANNVEGAYVSTDLLRAVAKKFWGSEAAVDFSTLEGKALAAKKIQDRQYAHESLVLCSKLWPITDVQDSRQVGPSDLESRVLSAVTGVGTDEDGLNRIGERVFNLQRAILVREGHRGREFDSLPDNWYTVPLTHEPVMRELMVPGKDGQPLDRRGAVVDRDQFERLKDEYYQLRGWDPATGLQKSGGLRNIGLADIALDLEKRNLAAG